MTAIQYETLREITNAAVDAATYDDYDQDFILANLWDLFASHAFNEYSKLHHAHVQEFEEQH